MQSQERQVFRLAKGVPVALSLGAVLLIIWLIETPPGLLGKADAIAFAVCHRIDLRSFHLEGRALPLCARCTGTYLGVALAFVTFGLRKHRPNLFPPKIIAIGLGLMALLWALDGINSALDLLPGFTSVYPPSNTLRLTTGMFFGIALASFIYPGFHQSAWKDQTPEHSVRSFGDVLILGCLGILMILVVRTENPLLLYPLALISSGTVVILLTMMYSILLMAWFKRENRATRWIDIAPIVLGGFSLSILQLGLFDLVRYSIFQTWGGFVFS